MDFPLECEFKQTSLILINFTTLYISFFIPQFLDCTKIRVRKLFKRTTIDTFRRIKDSKLPQRYILWENWMSKKLITPRLHFFFLQNTTPWKKCDPDIFPLWLITLAVVAGKVHFGKNKLNENLFFLSKTIFICSQKKLKKNKLLISKTFCNFFQLYSITW